MAPVGIPCLCSTLTTTSSSSGLKLSKSKTFLTTLPMPSWGNPCVYEEGIGLFDLRLCDWVEIEWHEFCQGTFCESILFMKCFDLENVQSNSILILITCMNCFAKSINCAAPTQSLILPLALSLSLTLSQTLNRYNLIKCTAQFMSCLILQISFPGEQKFSTDSLENSVPRGTKIFN